MRQKTARERSPVGSLSPQSSFIAGKVILPIAVLLVVVVSCVSDDSLNCLTVYKSGGAPAVIRSPKCARWRLPAGERRADCHVATLQGRRRSQEDRAFCALNTRIPFPGRNGRKEMNVGMLAVFDGHNGAEASEMASKLLPEYFFLHIYFILDGIYAVALKKASGRLRFDGEKELSVPGCDWSWNSNRHNFDFERYEQILWKVFDESFHLEILKESLVRTVHDIDATFSKEASANKWGSGSTATIIVKADGHVLVANVGDSKALLCSECSSSHHKRNGLSEHFHQTLYSDTHPVRRRRDYKPLCNGASTFLCVKELTEDHHPDRDDERSRIEAAGGYVVEWGGVSRVNGELAVSRSIGDVPFKSYGVIPIPEVTDWQTLSNIDAYLVAATDGVFDKLTSQDVCDIIWASQKRLKEMSDDNAESLADIIVNRAFETGSMDNMAVVVVPLPSSGTYPTLVTGGSDLERSAAVNLNNIHKHTYHGSDGKGFGSNLISVEYLSWILANINRILVRGSGQVISCFHLYENLKETGGHNFQPGENEERMFYLLQASPKAISLYHGDLPLYSDSKLCMNFLLDAEGDNSQCMNSEGFGGFLGLIGAVPFHEAFSNFSDSSSSDFRYILKRKFNRGSFGEVWLAYNWNCSHDKKNATLKFKKFVGACFSGPTNMSQGQDDCSPNNSSANHSSVDPDVEDLFILKRIMVEKGNAAYLSGLREKYFGEIFLNASMAVRGLTSTCAFGNLNEAQDFYQLLGKNNSMLSNMGIAFSYTNTCASNPGVPVADYEEGLNHIARYIESFESQKNELWLVFQNEGRSLSKLTYTTDATSSNGKDQNLVHIQIMRPSSWWQWLRKTEAGQEQMRSLIWQLLLALKSCHDRNITHRDVKPENMVICLEDKDTGKCFNGDPSAENQYNIRLRIIDFGSAIDGFTIKHLYGSKGPSRLEETIEYTPPEAMLNVGWFLGSPDITLKYDMWSVGVVMLELILGSPHVFQISSRTRFLLDQYLEGWSPETRELAYKLRAFMEMCILVPGNSPYYHSSGVDREHGGSWLASWKCTEEAFSQQVKAKDPLKLGFPNIWALRLVRQLLMWHPADRLSVDDALQHPYFHPERQK